MKSGLSGAVLQITREYASRVGAFRTNARLYLVNMVVAGAGMGIFRLLFNFYILSLGYDEVLVGRLVTTSSMASLLVALPCGYLADRLGRKSTLLIAGVFTSLSFLGMVIWPAVGILYLSNVLFGVAQSLAAVTMGPFLMENSGEVERTYLFSIASGLQMASASVGNWIGGFLPTWVAASRGIGPTDSVAYAGSLLAVSVLEALAILPLILLRNPRLEHSDRSVFEPLSYAKENPVLLSKLILPMLITSIGAGLIMPFMNVFFRQVHHQPDPVIGSLFAWGSLAMGVGLLIAPPLADRMGKIQMVVITQALSIPFLIMLGYSPWFWLSTAAYYVRLALMNMNTPVYNTFVMEQVEPKARATVASLVNMSWSFGWAFSPMLSGWLQVNYGFGPAFLGTIILYTISIVLLWVFFRRESKDTAPTIVLEDYEGFG
jgi:MFS family permease